MYLRKEKKKPLFDKTTPTKPKEKKPKKPRRRSLIEKLDKVFSKYIRLRDSKPYGYRMFRCISCGRFLPIEQADCGHYRSRTHMSTRFSEDNCNGECRRCNRMDGDHLLGYRANLVKKIGEGRVALLDYESTQYKHWDEFELEKLIQYYTALVAMMRKEGGMV